MGTKKTPLTRELVCATALHLVDERGLDALSMRTLAAELGVSAMALYRYAPNKAALLDAIADAVVLEIMHSDPGAETAAMRWEERTIATARAFRRTMMAHPAVLPLFYRRPIESPQSLRTFERLLELLRRAGFDDVTLVRAYYTLFTFTLGFVMTEVARPNETGDTQDREENKYPHRQVAGGEFPLLLELTPHVQMLGDEQFEFGLITIIDGLRTRLQPRHADAPESGSLPG